MDSPYDLIEYFLEKSIDNLSPDSKGKIINCSKMVMTFAINDYNIYTSFDPSTIGISSIYICFILYGEQDEIISNYFTLFKEYIRYSFNELTDKIKLCTTKISEILLKDKSNEETESEDEYDLKKHNVTFEDEEMVSNIERSFSELEIRIEAERTNLNSSSNNFENKSNVLSSNSDEDITFLKKKRHNE